MRSTSNYVFKGHNLLSALECVEHYLNQQTDKFTEAQLLFLSSMAQRFNNFIQQINIIKTQDMDEMEIKVKQKKLGSETETITDVIQVEGTVEEDDEVKKFKSDFEDKKRLIYWQTESLLEHIQAEKKRMTSIPKKDNHYETILRDLENCVNAFKESLDQYSNNYKGYAKNIIQLKQLANDEGATVKMFSQALDLNLGDTGGLCIGLVFKWIQDIKFKGFADNRFPLVKEVHQLQNKVNYFLDTSELVDSRKLNCAEGELDKLCNAVLVDGQDNTYLLVLYDKREGKEGHALGLRKLKSGHIELFDPNLGLFVFKDQHSLVNWFRHLLFCYRMRDAYFDRINVYYFAPGNIPIVEEKPSLIFDTTNEVKPVTSQDIESLFTTFLTSYKTLSKDLTTVECFRYLLDVLPSYINRIADTGTLGKVYEAFNKFADESRNLPVNIKQPQSSSKISNFFTTKKTNDKDHDPIDQAIKEITQMLNKQAKLLHHQKPQPLG